MVRLFFASDIHGSTICWRKFLSTPQRIRADVLVMGGDITGKLIVPVLSDGKGGYKYNLYGKDYTVPDEQALQTALRRIADHGFYGYLATEDEVSKLSKDKEEQRALFERLMVERLKEWLEQAREKLSRQNFMLCISPGNDDSFVIDEVLRSSPEVVFCDNNVVRISREHEMLSLSWVNETPWRTPRETSEEELEGMLNALFSQVEDKDRLVCNIHAPPYGSRLDLAPRLTEDLRVVVKAGQVEMVHVGSKAVRKAIERHQPLLGLHGHIHEAPGHAKIGRTLCLNPGSEYNEGILHGYVVDVEGNKVKDFWRMEL